MSNVIQLVPSAHVLAAITSPLGPVWTLGVPNEGLTQEAIPKAVRYCRCTSAELMARATEFRPRTEASPAPVPFRYPPQQSLSSFFWGAPAAQCGGKRTTCGGI